MYVQYILRMYIDFDRKCQELYQTIYTASETLLYTSSSNSS